MGHAGQSVDTRKIGEAVSYPGIDPRSFVSLAVVTKVSVEETGIICDVTLLPSQVPESAMYAPIYGGGGYGLYAPIEVEQLVIVLAPEGDPNEGLRIIGRAWDAGEPPPKDVTDHPADFLLVVKQDASCRITTAGTGTVVIVSDAKIELRSKDGTAHPLPTLAEHNALRDRVEDHTHGPGTFSNTGGNVVGASGGPLLAAVPTATGTRIVAVE